MIAMPGHTTLSRIYDGRSSLVFRTRRDFDKLPVIFKVLKGSYPTTHEIFRYKQEFFTTRSLADLTGVIRVYNLEKYQNTLVMSLEDFGAHSLDLLLEERSPSIDEFLKIAIRISEILGAIHRLNVIHKDINPSNIVMNPESGEIKIIDFGISTLLEQEAPSTHHPDGLEGTLPYISPEQTGRINRTIDYRTDYYSLGATFYEMLTGRHMFDTTDSLELIHCHIAKTPREPYELNSRIPVALSNIVMRLLSKNAEDRYQSASGIKADLEECSRQHRETGTIVPFDLGSKDVPERFQIPQKLYGRTSEIQEVTSAFKQVSLGEKVMLLVSGRPGIGKTSLVKEICRPIAAHKGHFVVGNYDQFGLHAPYSALVEALKELVRLVLSESEANLQLWRRDLLEILGSSGQVITDMIPEIELIIGPQPPAPKLDPMESRNRFNRLISRFVRLFCRPGHPLVLFLDDLQWADSASLDVLMLIMTDDETNNLLLICAFRDEEVDSAHPLLDVLKGIQKEHSTLIHKALGNLLPGDVNELVADTVHCEHSSAEPLARLVYRKAAGNPFFTIEFLKSIYRSNLLDFDLQSGRWKWDLEKIEARSITDNVVELLTGKITKLTADTQNVLKLAAGLGNRFDLATLAIVCDRPVREVMNSIKDGVSGDLLLPIGDAWKYVDLDMIQECEEITAEFMFAHDRIRQAAYRLIPDNERPEIHLRAGKLLLDNVSPLEIETRIFEIVHHLNQGAELIHDHQEHYLLAHLNLTAGKKAKKSLAFEPALQYLKSALAALEKSSWLNHYDLTLELHVEAAEAAYLCTRFHEMNRLSGGVLKNAKQLLDKVKVYEVMIQASIAQYKMPDAIRTALAVLRLLGMNIPEKPTQLSVLLGFIRTKALLFRKHIESLKHLPDMTDPNALAAVRIMSSVAKAAYAAQPEMAPIMVFKSIHMCLQYGNPPEAPFVYASYGVILSGLAGEIDLGYRFGKLASFLSDRLGPGKLKNRTVMAVNFFIKPWKEHYRRLWDSFQDLYQGGLETGNPEDAALTAYICCTCAYRTGMDLSMVDEEMSFYCDSIRKLKQESALRLLVVFHQAVLNLMGRASNPCRLIGDVYDETEMLTIHLQAKDRSAICVTYLNKLTLCYLFEEYTQAIESAELSRDYLDGVTGTPAVPVFYFYDSLARLAVYDSSRGRLRRNILRRVALNQRKMRKWALHGSMNHLHKYLLVEAERLRLRGKFRESEDCYDRSIELAKENEYINEEALANELAAKFFLARGKTNVARAYMADARYCYERWGAHAKVGHLIERYGHLLDEPSGQRTTVGAGRTTMSTVTGGGDEDMDLAWVVRASQAISGEIVLESLLSKLMASVIESAGAERGLLIQETDGMLFVTAEAQVDGENTSVLRNVPVEECSYLSTAIVNYVARTKENVVLNDASIEGKFTSDEYVQSKKPRSILCAPLIHQGKLSAILYLENNLAAGTFTPDRLEVLSVLCSQAAISLENAQLYERMEQLVAERTVELQQSNIELNKQIAEKELAQQAFLKAKVTAEAASRAKSDFLANMSHELRTPLNSIIGFSELLEDQIFGELSPKQLKHTGHIVRSGRHLLELINEILDLAKVEAGKLELNSTLLDIQPLLENCATMIREKALKHSIRLDVCIADELYGAEIRADGTKLKQIVFNLLSNAAKFTPDSGHIELSAEANGDNLTISVKDTGIGLKPQDADRIFDAFEQAHSSQQAREHGTGLGLALSRRLVELHGGKIWVETEGLGHGCTFRFTLPFRKASEERSLITGKKDSASLDSSKR
jgi:predicted ATPase/signal transduction histidine kinase